MYLTLSIGARTLAILLLLVATYVFGPIAPLVAAVGLILVATYRMAAKPRKPWMHAGLPALMVALLLLPAIALAATGAPETVAQSVSENTKVTWAWGEAAQSVAAGALYLLSMVAMWLFRKLPENVVAIIGNARVELLLSNAKNWGLNAVKGATDGKALSVDVGNAVLAEALSYALANGSSWLLSWGGGPEGIAQKIWARLNLDPAADAAAVPAITTAAVAAAA